MPIDVSSIQTTAFFIRTRDRVLKNNAKLKNDSEGTGLEARDQGFTRPKVLILAPFRNVALQIVKTLIDVSGTKQHDNKKRFMDEYGMDPEDKDDAKDAKDKRPGKHQPLLYKFNMLFVFVEHSLM